ncbi:MAG: response regulator transcription factor [Gammaproteobacteria bacterium]|nr:response regulator transcription factor [Gammaproteobacteria bacterium]
MVIRVLIVAHQRLIRQSLGLMLKQEPDIRVVGEAADGHEAFTLTLEKKPHILLMEADLPKLNAINTTRMILGCNPETRVLILSDEAASAHVSLALEAGAIGTVLTDVDHHELIRIIRHYAREKTPLASPFLTAHPVSEPEAPAVDWSVLTRRESEIVDLLARGLGSREIALTLSISAETVKVHIQHIYRKMGVKNRVEMLLSLQSRTVQ